MDGSLAPSGKWAGWVLEEGENQGKYAYELLTDEKRIKPWVKKDYLAHKIQR